MSPAVPLDTVGSIDRSHLKFDRKLHENSFRGEENWRILLVDILASAIPGKLHGPPITD
jgi:hypothetical protein